MNKIKLQYANNKAVEYFHVEIQNQQKCFLETDKYVEYAHNISVIDNDHDTKQV